MRVSFSIDHRIEAIIPSMGFNVMINFL